MRERSVITWESALQMFLASKAIFHDGAPTARLARGRERRGVIAARGSRIINSTESVRRFIPRGDPRGEAFAGKGNCD